MTNVEKVRKAYKTKTEARAWLRALKRLLRLYKRQVGYERCPLCYTTYPCTNCPWRLLGGGFCGTYRTMHFQGHIFGSYSDGLYAVDKAWRKRRLRQLPKWISYYEQALANWRQR